MQGKMNQLPRSEQPYEICWEKGAKALTDAQLLAVLLKSGVTTKNAVELSTDILNAKEGNLLSLVKLSRKELLSLKGIGKIKVMQMECIVEMASRISQASLQQKETLNNAFDIYQKFVSRLRFLTKEHLYALFFDTKCHLIKEELLSVGTVNASIVSPREIFKKALEHNAVFVVLVHNHPSGDPTPSSADVEVTKIVKKCGEMMEISLLDHIIIGDNKYISLKEYDLF